MDGRERGLTIAAHWHDERNSGMIRLKKEAVVISLESSLTLGRLVPKVTEDTCPFEKGLQESA